MKALLKKIVIALLKRRTRLLLSSGVRIIGVTGSLGKTTAVQAIKHILQSKYTVSASSGGFNTEIGILLTLLGEHESGFSSLKKWSEILFRAYTTKISVPDIFVLEYGVDAPGDMENLIDLVHPHIAVITKISPVHMEKGQFQSIDEIRREKEKLALALPKDGIAFLNFDEEHIRAMQDDISAPIISYGTAADVTWRILGAVQKENGISFSLQTGDLVAEFFAPFLGTYHAHTLTPAILIGEKFGISLEKSATLLKKFTPLPGRGRIFPGKNGSTIWDSSYNASFEATESALKTLPEVPGKRKIALLGTMNELGEHAEEFHEELGKIAARSADQIFFVGKHHESFSRGVSGKKPLRIFGDSESAGMHLAEKLKEDDFVLVKGSQNGVYLEKAVEHLLEDSKDTEFLCRRSSSWGKIRGE